MLIGAIVSIAPLVNAADIYINPNIWTGGGYVADGTKFKPYLTVPTITSNNNYYIAKGTVLRQMIETSGVINVLISSYGVGEKPIIDAEWSRQYGVHISNSTNVTISDIAVRNAMQNTPNLQGACIAIDNTNNFLITNYLVFDCYFGIRIGDGVATTTGTISNGQVYHSIADGIASWSIPHPITITGNVVTRFGNDGIDVLGSTGAIVSNNIVSESYDSEDAQYRGTTHAGIKAGGNCTLPSDCASPGSGNQILNNTVHHVQHFGVFNRNAQNNVYTGNTAYNNGCNFNFVGEAQESTPTVTNNISYNATYEGGLDYGIYIPNGPNLTAEGGNSWDEDRINIDNVGIVTNQSTYRANMLPINSTSTMF